MLRKPHIARPVIFRIVGLFGAALAMFGVSSRALAHGVPEASREALSDGGIAEYIWLGAEHMVTGYDHLLFLFGVIFFLKGFRDVVRFITAFTLGHCITLLGATLAGVTANAYLIDAVIALSVIYKGFENLDGFDRFLRVRAPNLLAMVFVFGLIHGFGLSTRLQELPLGEDGLIYRILAFNVGVELGQVAALTVMLGLFKLWRSSKAFDRFTNIANSALVLAGLGLFFYQVEGYLHEADHEATHQPEVEEQIVNDHIGASEQQHEDGHGHEDEAILEPVENMPEEAADQPVEHVGGHSHSHGEGGHTH